MIVFDASVLIAHLNPTDAHHQRAGNLLRGALDHGFGASPITLAEALVAPARSGAVERATALLRELGIRAVDLATGSPMRLAPLRLHTGLKLPDCCVLHAAELVGAAVATFDERLADAARARGSSVLD